jgi:Transposase DDE domain
VHTGTPPAPAACCRWSWSRGAPPNDENLLAGGANREALGRSRGGLTTKVHLVADRRCRPVTRILSPGQHADCPQFIPLMDQIQILRRGKGRPRTRPGRAMGDKACSSAANRRYLRRRGIKAVIPARAKKTRRITAAPGASAEAGLPPSMPRAISSATPSSAA